MKQVTLRDIAAREMSPEARKTFLKVLEKSCEDQEKLLEKAREKDNDTNNNHI